MYRDISLLFMRIWVGGIFVLAGGIKMFEPHEEFMYAIAQYDILPDVLISPFAYLLPFVEVIFGIFLIIGLFHRISSAVIGASLVAFIIALSTVIWGSVAIEDCGCFGMTLSILDAPPPELLFRDVVLLAFSATIFLNSPSRWSLDKYLSTKNFTY